MSSDPSRSAAAQKGGSQGSEALQKLKRGEYTLEQYIDDRVGRAMQRMGRVISAEDREMLREVLREQALLDPVIQEYLRRATGRELTPEAE